MITYATITLTDFGVSLDGEHFYAKITVYVSGSHMGSSDVTQIMDAELADRLNKKDGSVFHRDGDDTERFEGRESAIERSAELIKEKWPFVKNVFIDSKANPTECILCEDENIQLKLNDIHTQYEKCYKNTNDPWKSGLGDIVDDLHKQWDCTLKLIK